MVKYKYFVNNTEVFPIDNRFANVAFEKPTVSSVFLEKKIDGNLQFNSKAPFDFKSQQELDPTVELDFTIKQLCNGIYSDFVKAIFTVGEGDFDDDNCLFTVKTKTKNEFRKDIPVNIIIKQNLINPGAISPDSPGVVFTNPLSPTVDDINYVQAFYFDQTLLSVAQESNPSIVGIISNFFQINPTVISSDALPGVPNKWSNMAFASLSDTQIPLPGEVAQFETITFQELFDDLNALFDVYWFIDANNYLRVEHRIFFDGVLGLDLTTQRFRKYLLGTKKYNYDLTNNYPRTETLKLVNSKQYAKYTNGYFATINQNTNEAVYQTTKINVDLTNIIYYGGSSSQNGVVLFACDGVKSSSTFFVYTDLFSVEDYENGFTRVMGQNVYLTPHYLFKYIHLYGRYDSGSFIESRTDLSAGSLSVDPLYYIAGQLRAGGIKHKTVRPIILQNKIKIPLCCDDVFNSSNLIKTELGLGLPQTASFDLNTEMLELSLKYPAPEYKFTPLNIPNLALWLRGNSGIIYGAPSGLPGLSYITEWRDSSGHGRHAVGGPANYPINSIGSPGAIFQNGGSGLPYLTIPGFQLFPNKRGTIFLLYKIDFDTTTPRDGYIISTNDGGPGSTYDICVRDSVLFNFHETSSSVYPQNFYTDHRLFQLKRFADDKIICRDNSRDIPNYQLPIGFTNAVNNPQIIDNVNYAVKDIILGYNPNLPIPTFSNAFTLLEVIIYDSVLSDVDCERVELYLTKTGYYKIGTKVKEEH